MIEHGLTKPERNTTFGKMNGTMMRRAARAMAAIVLAGGTAACVNISAPEKPIVINLNISVTQEVVYRLDGEAKSLIKQNPGIF